MNDLKIEDINIKDYLMEQKRDYETIVSLLDEMESAGGNFITYKGVHYNRFNVIGLLSRIENRIDGAVAYQEKTNNNSWRKVHRILLQKYAEKEHDYHMEVDGVFAAHQTIKYIKNILKNHASALPESAISDLKNALNKSMQVVSYMRSGAKEKWVKDRFFELASTLEFEEGGKIYPINLEKIEEIHPLDVVRNSYVDFEVLKDAGNDRNVFVDSFESIKEEALKEALLEDEMEKQE